MCIIARSQPVVGWLLFLWLMGEVREIREIREVKEFKEFKEIREVVGMVDDYCLP